mmetsp:Transcript_126884/g.237170  ORF Transcript_126884/g.237170 Transcript_126884/m.237170 type:complete len:298 (-) Transcript_126884:1920-2813(-)
MCSAALMHGAPQRTARRPTCSSHVEMCRARSVGLEIGQRRNAARVMPRRCQNAGMIASASASAVRMQSAGRMRPTLMSGAVTRRNLASKATKGVGLAYTPSSIAAWQIPLHRTGSMSSWPMLTRSNSMAWMSSTLMPNMGRTLATTPRAACCVQRRHRRVQRMPRNSHTSQHSQWHCPHISAEWRVGCSSSCGFTSMSLCPFELWRWALGAGSSPSISNSACATTIWASHRKCGDDGLQPLSISFSSGRRLWLSVNVRGVCESSRAMHSLPRCARRLWMRLRNQMPVEHQILRRPNA